MFDHKIVRGAISKDKAEMACDYFLSKKDVAMFLGSADLDSMGDDLLKSFYGNMGDHQVHDAYCIYGDVMADLIMSQMTLLVEEQTGLKVVPSFSYTRIYEKGNLLFPHKDRDACKVAVTMNLGGELWPIYLDGKEVILSPGDMLLYNGCEEKHWRNTLEEGYCVQSMFFYNEPGVSDFDERPMLGISKNIVNHHNKEKQMVDIVVTKPYQALRREAYDSVENQLDMQYHDLVNGTSTWQDHIKSVKDRHPKPTL